MFPRVAVGRAFDRACDGLQGFFEFQRVAEHLVVGFAFKISVCDIVPEPERDDRGRLEFIKRLGPEGEDPNRVAML
ncbi:MAG: hypothetical protein IPJ30_03975 [Acidobacteria bacterium]|nr:hypothetical protein [Acidobacteriota bacterium]